MKNVPKGDGIKRAYSGLQELVVKFSILVTDMAADFWSFFFGWFKYLFLKQLLLLRQLEKGKSLAAGVLYKGRGRFSKPFLHSGMGGLAIAGILIAPVLANSFPSLAGDSLAQMESPSSVLSSVTEAYEELSTTVSEKPRSEVTEYTVTAGDTVSGIAQKFNVSIDTVRWSNDLASIGAIKPGQVLKIPPVTGIIHKVKKGETVNSIAKYYNTESQGIVDYPFNSFVNDETFELAVGQSLVVPDGIMPKVELWSPSTYIARQTPNAGTVVASGRFVWPTAGRISQGYRWYHPAIDIATGMGVPVLAADAGRIVIAGWPDNVGYGNRVLIDHGNSFTTLYAHLSKISVNVGQTVNRGDLVGLVGSTGRSTGPHLHFEIRNAGKVADPMTYLR